MNVFKLPDLGEGLPEAEIVRWFVKVGDVVEAEQPLVEMETAKAVVEVPSPESGRIANLHGEAGDIIETGAPLVTFGNAEETKSHQNSSDITADELESTAAAKGFHAAPQVQALARKLRVNLNTIEGSGKNRTITLADVRNAATQTSEEKPPAIQHSTESNTVTVNFKDRPKVAPKVRTAAQAHGIDIHQLKPSGHQDNVTLKDVQNKRVHKPSTKTIGVGKYQLPQRTQEVTGKPLPMRNERRSMALNMAKARDNTVNTTICEKADITQWPEHSDISVRLIRAVTAACMVEPSLNAWFDGEKAERTLHTAVNIGLAVDSPRGLSVPVIHNAETKSFEELRADINRLRETVYNQSIRPEELKNATITLSNFGMIAGIYATPIVTPPQVAIVATGRVLEELKLTEQGIINSRYIPVSLSFDHRGATGADAARFLAAFVADLSLPY